VHSPRPVSAPASASGVAVRVADRHVYDRLLARYRGKVVLVDFWATWCRACIRQFRHTVEMHARYADRGLAVISVSLDDPDEIERVRTFLVEQKATFDNLLGHAGSGAETFDAFNLEGVPHYRVYGRTGAIRHTFTADALADEQFTPEAIEEAIVESLADGTP
jgi:peroxiredoxin